MSKIKTLYGEIDPQVFEKLKDTRLLACDVDGVFSDGRIYMGNDGEELKTFHTKDGYGVKALLNEGIEVAIITGRKSRTVGDRFTALGVKHIIQGETGKKAALSELQETLKISAYQTCSIGDDLPDTGMFALSSVGVAPVDAHPTVIEQSDYQTVTAGGFGCVREICDLILLSQGKLEGEDDTLIRSDSV